MQTPGYRWSLGSVGVTRVALGFAHNLEIGILQQCGALKKAADKIKSFLTITGCEPRTSDGLRPGSLGQGTCKFGGFGWGAGGLGSRGLDRPAPNDRAQKPAQPRKEAGGKAAPERELRQTTTSPRFPKSRPPVATTTSPKWTATKHPPHRACRPR